VLGGSAVGCELGQAFARLGSQVTIVEALDRLIPREEPRAATVLATRLNSEGIDVLTSTRLARAMGVLGSVELEITGPDDRAVLRADRVLVATGRRPRTDGLGLDAAGVAVDERGHVTVDSRLRTSNRRVYAAGDVTGGPAFTHVAGIHGSIAATNALLGPLRRVDHDTMPRVTFTDPEIAHVGLTEDQARRRHGERVRVRTLRNTEVDRAVTEDDTDGFTQVVLGRGNRVLGATIVAPRAGEMLAEPAAVVARGGRLRAVSSVVHAYPTWADGVWNTALAEANTTLTSPAVRLLMALRRTTSQS
jgi:pyruvate/2-oxoglutarate dehydrogenase complex dihydrolipoamide dehydrogenase (E3) component